MKATEQDLREFSKLAGRAMNQACDVLSTIEPEDTDEFDSLSDLKEEMQAAIEGMKP